MYFNFRIISHFWNLNYRNNNRPGDGPNEGGAQAFEPGLQWNTTSGPEWAKKCAAPRPIDEGALQHPYT